MNLRQIEAFRAVMMTGTVTSAADLLHVSQPAVSRLISDLERSSGLALFKRTKRRLQPTPEALTFYNEVQHAFMGLGMLRQKAHDISHFKTGHLRIAALPALTNGLLPLALRDFLAQHPDVTVSLQTRSSATVEEWVAAQQFDFGLIGGMAERSGMNAELFAVVDGVCVLPLDHPLASKPSIETADLQGQPFISLAIEDITRHRIDETFKSLGVTRVMNMETKYAGTICSCVALGLGVSIISPFAVDDFTGSRFVVKRFIPAIPIQYMVLFPALRPMSALATAFVATLKNQRDRALDQFKALGLMGQV